MALSSLGAVAVRSVGAGVGYRRGRGDGVSNESATLEEALAAFVEAFNRLDWERFRALFRDEASVFFPATQARRATGRAETDAGWPAAFAEIRDRSGAAAPPYQQLRPDDLLIQAQGDVAVVSFHLQRADGSLGRRTLVWARDPAGWRILHLHASNVATS